MRGPDASPPESGNAVFAFLPNPAAYEPALYKLLDGAKHRLSVVMYIFRPDESGVRFLDALVGAARRGVAVRLVIDAHGCLFTPDPFFGPLVRAGGEVARFGSRLGARYLVRLHQKLVAADGDRAIIGGFNIGNEYFDPAEDEDFRELGLHIDHPTAGALHDHVERLHAWCQDESQGLAGLRQLLATTSDPPQPLQWLHGGAGARDSPLLCRLNEDLSRARQLDAITAYFAPPEAILRLVEGVAARGRVRLVVAGKTDVPLARAAARHFYKRLLEAGCELLEYDARPLHAKLMVLDDVVYAGSANMDPRSLFTNVELALRIESPDLAARARGLIAADVPRSRRMTSDGPIGGVAWPARLGRAIACALLYRLDAALARLLLR